MGEATRFEWRLHGASPSVLRLVGELDSVSGPLHIAAILRAIDGHLVEIDASDLEFIDSSGLRVLLALAEANGGAIGLRAAQPAVRRLIEIMDLDHTLRLAPHWPDGRAEDERPGP